MKTIYILRKDGIIQRKKVKLRTFREYRKVQGSGNLFQSRSDPRKKIETEPAHKQTPEGENKLEKAQLITGLIGVSYEESNKPFFAECKFTILTNKQPTEEQMFQYAETFVEDFLASEGMHIPVVRDRAGIESRIEVDTSLYSYFEGLVFYASRRPPSKYLGKARNEEFDSKY